MIKNLFKYISDKLKATGYGLLLLLLITPLSLTAAEPVATVQQQPPPSNIPAPAPVQLMQPAQTVPQTTHNNVQPIMQGPAAVTAGPSIGTTSWFIVFNVTNKEVPGSFYAYSIESTSGGCVSSCTQTGLAEDSGGVSEIPESCRAGNCPYSFTLFLHGKPAGPSCTNINTTNLSEVWVHVSDNQFSAICQAF